MVVPLPAFVPVELEADVSDPIVPLPAELLAPRELLVLPGDVPPSDVF
jgi:hypothetical protein